MALYLHSPYPLTYFSGVVSIKYFSLPRVSPDLTVLRKIQKYTKYTEI